MIKDMSQTKVDHILQHYIDRNGLGTVKELYLKLYNGYPQNFTKVFAFLHQWINDLFEPLNKRIAWSHYYLAEDSRQLIWIIEDIESLNRDLSVYGEEIIVDKEYNDIFGEAKTFLMPYRGSQIPETFSKVRIIYYEPVFSTGSKKILITHKNQNLDLQTIGEWAFSIVSKYEDPTYGKYFAVKKLKKNSSEREKERFKKEFEILQKLSFPYILEVYAFDKDKDSYIMEHCDSTLKKYIEKFNGDLPSSTRKRIALQFLYAVNYLHSKKILHRDISYNNILIKQFDWAVMIKLSDFGLMKEYDSDFTKTDTEIKWTIIDPSLTYFKDYSMSNEVYSIGFILNYIFTGKKSFQSTRTNLSKIVEKCIDSNLANRFWSVAQIISQIELLPIEQ